MKNLVILVFFTVDTVLLKFFFFVLINKRRLYSQINELADEVKFARHVHALGDNRLTKKIRDYNNKCKTTLHMDERSYERHG